MRNMIKMMRLEDIDMVCESFLFVDLMDGISMM